jgi:hypothetical protein
MDIPTIIKALAALAPHANKIVDGIRAANSSPRTEERIQKLEADLLHSGEILLGLTRQLQAVAEELKAQSEVSAAREKSLKTALGLSAVALCAAIAALAVVLFKPGG